MQGGLVLRVLEEKQGLRAAGRASMGSAGSVLTAPHGQRRSLSLEVDPPLPSMVISHSETH